MANIKVEISNENDLTVFHVEGSITADEILDSKSKYYKNEPTKYVIWDFRGGTATKITTNEFHELAHYMKSLSISRKGGKTAIVAESELDFGLGRMYSTYASLEELPIDYRVFHNIEDATIWISEKVD